MDKASHVGKQAMEAAIAEREQLVQQQHADMEARAAKLLHQDCLAHEVLERH